MVVAVVPVLTFLPQGYGSVASPQPKAKLTKLVAALRKALDAAMPAGRRAQLTLDTTMYPAQKYWWTGYDWPELAKSLDFFVIMAYVLLISSLLSSFLSSCSCPC